MAKFAPAYNISGEKTGHISPLYIAKATAIEKGEVVVFTPATGVAAVAEDFDDPAIGVALEDHDGSTAGRQSGEEIKVQAAPGMVYELKSTNDLTLTGGSTSTAVIATLVPATDDIFIGGYAEVVTCAASADMVGRMLKITDSTGATGTLKFATQAAALAANDKIRLHPGRRAIGTCWDLTSDGTDINYASQTAGAGGMRLVDADPENRLAFYKLALHQLGENAHAI
jgi:hypothetical protein